MKQTPLFIGTIPALLWGPSTGRLMVAVHGNLSHKGDTVIQLLAHEATAKGYQVLSFDLPRHGDRKDECTPCTAEVCVEELRRVLAYAQTLGGEISLFGCSLGAYFSLVAYRESALKQALFLSPVVDMQRLIAGMMEQCQVSEARLQAEKTIPTPMGETLDWDYYQYVKAHPIVRWDTPTHILYGGGDSLCAFDTIDAFARRFACHFTVYQEGAHFFYTPQQLNYYQAWLAQTLKEAE